MTAPPITAAEGLSGGAITDILQDREGVLTTKDGLPNNIVESLYEDSRGTLWFGTQGGLARRRDGQWRVFAKKDGLSGYTITNILEATGGGLWLGSPRGLDFLDDSGVRRQGPERALAGRNVTGLVLDRDDPKTL